ncbi:hypothetical protein llap_4195 [Limosa lapponica baueri]|uniref:Uncharacterized protein n=1 Tax=Limosa lapponica baueri TaxID=1758121 RepID=A0A2I0UHK1_LIMLA|nr:hypothetical protein llap_4195 [Limosa lapponica baueri]
MNTHNLKQSYQETFSFKALSSGITMKKKWTCQGPVTGVLFNYANKTRELWRQVILMQVLALADNGNSSPSPSKQFHFFTVCNHSTTQQENILGSSGTVSPAGLVEVPIRYVGMDVKISHSAPGDIISVSHLDKMPTVSLIHM